MKKYRLLTQEGYPKLVKGNIYSSEYNDFEDINISVKELVVLFPQDWELVEDDFVLPKKWCVKTDSAEKERLVREYFNRTFAAKISNFKSDENWYFSYPAYSGLYVLRSLPNDIEYSEITFDQFKTYVLNVKEKKEIIGYKLKEKYKNDTTIHKAAIAIEGGIVFGTLSIHSRIALPFKEFDCSASVTKLEQAGVLNLWFEPVYGETVPQIVINGHKGKFFDNYVKFGCAEIDKKVFTTLVSSGLLNKLDFSNKAIESITIGIGTFTKEQIKEIAEYYLNKN